MPEPLGLSGVSTIEGLVRKALAADSNEQRLAVLEVARGWDADDDAQRTVPLPPPTREELFNDG